MSNTHTQALGKTMAALVLITLAYVVLSTRANHCRDNQHCSKCDTNSGHCITECETGYFDRKCTSVCSENCKQKKCKLLESLGIGNCTEGCEPGYQGSNCNVACFKPPENCSKCPGGCEGHYCNKGASCFPGCQDFFYGSDCRNCSSRCISCNRISGTCDRCHLPYYGLDCEYTCNNCSRSCEARCEGCTAGHFGKDCEPCSEVCANYTCNSNIGTCFNMCNNGMYGQFCNLTSNLCMDDACGQKTGNCIDGCFITEEGCTHNCSRAVTTTECTTGSCVTDYLAARSNIPYVAALIVALIVLFGTTSVCYICYRMGRSSTRNTQLDEVIHSAVTEQVETGEYQALHRYWEIREADMNTECDPSNSQEIAEGMASAFPVVADCSGGTGENIIVSSPGTTDTYTATDARYLSPILTNYNFDYNVTPTTTTKASLN